MTLLAVSANLMACGGSDATESSAENDAEQIEAEVTAQTENADALNVDQAYRLTLLELGITE